MEKNPIKSKNKINTEIFNEYYQGIEKETKDIHKYFEEVKEISNRRGFNIYVFYYN